MVIETVHCRVPFALRECEVVMGRLTSCQIQKTRAVYSLECSSPLIFGFCPYQSVSYTQVNSSYFPFCASLCCILSTDHTNCSHSLDYLWSTEVENDPLCEQLTALQKQKTPKLRTSVGQ